MQCIGSGSAGGAYLHRKFFLLYREQILVHCFDLLIKLSLPDTGKCPCQGPFQPVMDSQIIIVINSIAFSKRLHTFFTQKAEAYRAFMGQKPAAFRGVVFTWADPLVRETVFWFSIPFFPFCAKEIKAGIRKIIFPVKGFFATSHCREKTPGLFRNAGFHAEIEQAKKIIQYFFQMKIQPEIFLW